MEEDEDSNGIETTKHRCYHGNNYVHHGGGPVAATEVAWAGGGRGEVIGMIFQQMSREKNKGPCIIRSHSSKHRSNYGIKHSWLKLSSIEQNSWTIHNRYGCPWAIKHRPCPNAFEYTGQGISNSTFLLQWSQHCKIKHFECFMCRNTFVRVQWLLNKQNKTSYNKPWTTRKQEWDWLVIWPQFQIRSEIRATVTASQDKIMIDSYMYLGNYIWNKNCLI